MKKLVLICLVLFFTVLSCITKEESIQTSEFEQKAQAIFEELSQYYGEGVVFLKLEMDNDGNKVARYYLSEEARDYMWMMEIFGEELLGEKGSRESIQEEDGTTCEGYDCVREVKKCHRRDMDALVSEGACAKYCVTCKEKE